MKKQLNVEIVLLAVVLLVAVIALVSLLAREPVPAMSDDVTKETTQETTQETQATEPEPTWMELPETRQLTAKQAFVYDCQEETFTFLLGSQTETVYPASITKLFTAYVALQYLQPQHEITAGDALDLVGPGSSVAEIEKGDTLTVEKLIEAMLLPSGNDAAYILAVEVGRQLKNEDTMGAWYASDVFIEEMNRQAKELGMTGTHFTNPDGYHDSQHYTTFQDMAVIGKLALENGVIMKYANMAEDEFVSLNGETRQWKNTNLLVNPQSEYYCPIATGLKTGQTPSAGSCLLSSFEKGDQRYIIGVFGCPEIEDRFADTLQLLNGFYNKCWGQAMSLAPLS